MGASDMLVWIDCEMTGLDLSHDALVEVACIVTDAELNELDDGINLVIQPPAAAAESMNDVVRTMHTESGLINEFASGTTLRLAEMAVLDYIKSHVSDPGRAPLAGSTVYVDRGFLARDMPAVNDYLHYRLVDASTIKELARRWYPQVYFAAPAKHGGHRALADIRESIAELRYYREALFPASPGPESSAVREIAARHELKTAH